MCVLSCFVQLKSVLLISCVCWIFFQNTGSQLCFRFFFLLFNHRENKGRLLMIEVFSHSNSSNKCSDKVISTIYTYMALLNGRQTTKEIDKHYYKSLLHLLAHNTEAAKSMYEQTHLIFSS